MAASKLFGGCLQAGGSIVDVGGGGHNGAQDRSADFYFQRLISKVSEQGNKLLQVFEQMARELAELGQERERLAQAKVELNGEMEVLREQSERRRAEERRLMREEMADFQAACEQKVASIARKAEDETFSVKRDMARFQKECDSRVEEATRRAAELGAECERRLREKEGESSEMARKLVECQAECERRLADERLEMTRQTGAFFAECSRTMDTNKEEMTRRMNEFRLERERLEEEKTQVVHKMVDLRAESQRRMEEEEANMSRRMAGLREECERRISAESEAAERRLGEAQRRNEEQLRTQKQITDHIVHVLRELPPLQTAMELGDLGVLEEELSKWAGAAVLPERFGECKGVVEAVLSIARDRLATWRGVERMWKDVLREVDHHAQSSTAAGAVASGSLSVLTQQSQRVFRVLKEAQLTKMDLHRSDPEASQRVCEVLLAWQERAMSHSNAVQRLIIRKVVTWPQLGSFDFADLDICLRLADRRECRGDVFLSRAQALVEDSTTSPSDLRPLLSHVETMLYFLKYAKSEDLQLAHRELRRQAFGLEPLVAECLQSAEREYAPGAELVRLAEGCDLLDCREVESVLEELRRGVERAEAGGHQPAAALRVFREIFYQWAKAMHARFGLLVLPHHTQVLCLLAFKHFLEAAWTPAQPRALIAQVGTGEGKSMIVAALAIYVVVALGKKAHVVMDDEVLLERDFWTFKNVFDAFEVAVDARSSPGDHHRRRNLSAVICVSEEKVLGRAGGDSSCLVARVDPAADICYCEAKHVQSFYASLARDGNRDFDGYASCVLILDEVDALVIDEEPNEAFVYHNRELSELATVVAGALGQNASPEALTSVQKCGHPAAGRVVAEMSKEWARAKQMHPGEDFEYAKETGRYCALHAGRADAKTWSLALECRNFQDGLSREILFKERLFVMSRPRVFRKYHRILGLSGSIGSKPEQGFLKDTYSAAFMTVPPFLKTCKGSPFHEAVPVKLGERQRIVYIEPTQESQILRLAEVALRARERVPVLIIARDRRLADHFVERLRQVASSQGLGALSDDIVRSLSRTLYEADGERWKENLNRATLPVGEGGSGSRGKSWRITVADPRGGRGTDYRIDDQDVEAHGGLLLVPTWIPTSRREWTQFLGRTARQDCRGQFCCVLCAGDYSSLSSKYKQALPSEGGVDVVERVLLWGDREASERIRGSAALYNSGVRANELCEEVFSQRLEILECAAAREHLVDACQRLRWMSVREVDAAFERLPGLDPAKVPTEARDLGRPAEPLLPPLSSLSLPPSAASAASAANPQQPQQTQHSMEGSPLAAVTGTRSPLPQPPKTVVFCLDWSASMQSRDTRTPLSRFETCVACLQRILREQVRDCDLVGVVAFGSSVQVVVPPTLKGQGRGLLEARIAGLRPQAAGGTCFFDAVAQCLELLSQPDVTQAEALPWLVCLTDGDDLGSRPQNAKGQLVTQMLEAGMPARLSMVMITVGALRVANVQVIGSWVERVHAAGGLARHLSEQDAATIARAFDVVAECLAVEVGGATEC